jgi:hypothetical protein
MAAAFKGIAAAFKGAAGAAAAFKGAAAAECTGEQPEQPQPSREQRQRRTKEEEINKVKPPCSYERSARPWEWLPCDCVTGLVRKLKKATSKTRQARALELVEAGGIRRRGVGTELMGTILRFASVPLKKIGTDLLGFLWPCQCVLPLL